MLGMKFLIPCSTCPESRNEDRGNEERVRVTVFWVSLLIATQKTKKTAKQ